MNAHADDRELFDNRFVSREQAERYRDRYTSGRRGRIDRLEREALRYLLEAVGRVSVAMDMPAGTGRLTPVLAKVADRVILADGSPVMLALAREALPDLDAEYLETDAQAIAVETGSVDLVFSHRFLHHIHDPAVRRRIFSELSRVSRRYVIMSYYTPGFRDRFRWLRSRLIPGAVHRDRPVNLAGFFREAAAVGLSPIRMKFLRRFPLTALFCLFERTGGDRQL